MAQKMALISIGIVLLVCLTLMGTVQSTHGQGAVTSVHSLPFIHVGHTYNTGVYEFQIIQDFGNGWVAARRTIGSSAVMFVNLHQTPVLFPIGQ